MSQYHPEIAAAVLEAELMEMLHPAEIDPAQREHLAARVGAALRSAMTAEREACAALCAERQALWEQTESAATTPEPLRAESRCRCNEAAHLADVIRERTVG